MKKLFTALFLGLASTFAAFAQIDPRALGQLTDVLPPSPEASAIARHAGVPVNLSTGALSLTLPLYTISSGKLSVATSISYSAGVKVDEIASRVGMGWALNAGGVVTRTVLDDPDETVPIRLKAPASLTTKNAALLNFLKNAGSDMLSPGSSNGFDNQADIFSFSCNGYSGKFIIDTNGNVLQIPKSSLRIQTNFGSADYDIKITDPSGIVYLFGGQTATESTKSANTLSCGRIYGSYIPTAWYLKKILHPNGDYIQFNYVANVYDYYPSVSQTLTRTPTMTAQLGCYTGYYNEVILSTPCGTINENKTCASLLRTDGRFLTEIVSSKGGSIALAYGNSTRIDLPGEKALARIELRDPANVTLNSYHLVQAQLKSLSPKSNSMVSTLMPGDTSRFYRMYLRELVQRGRNDAYLNSHSLNYYEPRALPGRLSFAQDHYGFYNGVDNGWMIPQSSLGYNRVAFPGINANRAANQGYSFYGSLSSIRYPTGGKDSIYYEGHVRRIYKFVKPPEVELHVTGTGLEGRTQVTHRSDTVTIGSNHDIVFNATCSFVQDTGYPYDTLHNYLRVSLRDLSSAASSGWTKMVPGNFRTLTQQLLAGHSYVIEIRAEGEMIRGDASLYYQNGVASYQTVDEQVGGIRVAKVETYSEGVKSGHKKYHYLLNGTTSSSGETVSYDPEYYSVTRSTLNCTGTYEFTGNVSCIYINAHSNSQVNLFNSSGSHIYYKSVMVSHGDDNFVLGGEAHGYLVESDLAATTFIGDPIQGAPHTDLSWKNGQETYSATYKKAPGGLVKLSETIQHYKVDGATVQTDRGFMVKKDFDSGAAFPPDQPVAYLGFHGSTYTHTSAFLYADTVKNVTYDETGSNPITQVTLNSYNHRYLLAGSSTGESDGTTTFREFKYSADHPTITGFDSGQLALFSQLDNNGLTGFPVQVAVKNDTTTVERVRISYKTNAASSNVVQDRVSIYNTLSKALEQRVENVSYDAEDKILTQRMASGINISYRYGYNGMYPVVQARNAAHNEFYHNNFEDTGSAMATAHTGLKHSGGSYTVSWTAPNARNYVATYWYHANDRWNFKSENYNGSSLGLSGGSKYDDICIFPGDAELSTYTYFPMVGMASQTDAKGLTVYYEYDDFQRLMNIRDQYGNIVKNMGYNYDAGQNNAAAWTDTNLKTCAKAGGVNTGEQLMQQVDANPYSPTYNTYRNRSLGVTGGCPVPTATVYAKITYDNESGTLRKQYADIVLSFYSDAACTVPVSVSGLSINYHKTSFDAESTYLGVVGYSTVVSGSVVTLLTHALVQDNDSFGNPLYFYFYNLAASEGYTIVL